ncbi:trimeric intracellular cation channel family protein [Phaeacidiphilus oryzae]|uniref:trimeric intracellular cation channel family protein n=1 Tax=Phaeacidiphilus oryzae TaxID=348818 RepID=UPI00068C16D4|nr:TRIC cation channel family protein [Phaeacidiphilus oryzae]
MELATDTITTAQKVVDHIATFAFAVSGALLAVRKNYDVFGLAVLACAAAVGGGVIRDLIIAQGPPIAFVDQSYFWISVAAAALIFVWHPPTRLTGWPLDITDAVGLGLFCVTGTVKAYHSGLGAVPSALLGMVTAIGGGVIRDMLAGEQPGVLRWDRDLYAVPALVGASLTALMLHFGWYRVELSFFAAAAALVVRLLALHYHWHAPRARGPSKQRVDPGEAP